MSQFEYKVIRSKRVTAGATISVHPERGVTVRAPFWLPAFAIKKFVEEKSDWIIKHLSVNTPKSPEKKYEPGENHLYFGREYPLTLRHRDHPGRTSVEIAGEVLVATIYKGYEGEKRRTEIQDGILRWYLETGIQVITEKVNYYSEQIGVEYSRIDIKKVSTIWGSCSPDNKLCFNRKLIMAPHEIVNYVVIHEVCHMVHRNHSSHFWGLVAKYDPRYKEHRRWLHRNHLLLSI